MKVARAASELRPSDDRITSTPQNAVNNTSKSNKLILSSL